MFARGIGGFRSYYEHSEGILLKLALVEPQPGFLPGGASLVF